MSVTIQTLAAPNTDYVARLNNNFTALKAAVETLQAQILGSVGAGSQLVTDLFDRAGVVKGYELDIDNYAGEAEIDIGEVGTTSVAWGEFTGVFDRVQMPDAVTLDASGIVSALPKTIYVAVPSNGTPQLYEADNVLNVVYLWSMTWDGITLTEFVRLGTLLPGYDLIESMARRAEIWDLFDSETDWLSDEQGMTSILLPGANTDNELAEMSYEVIGFVCNTPRFDEDGFYATESDPNDADRNRVKFKVVSEGEEWMDSADEDEGIFNFDCSQQGDFQFIPVNPDRVTAGDVYVVEARTFELERVYLGDFVESARAFQWGVVVRPIYGPPLPLDPDFVDGI